MNIKLRFYWLMHELTYRLYVWGSRWWMRNAPDNQSWWGDNVPAIADKWRYGWQNKISANGYTVYGDRIIKE